MPPMEQSISQLPIADQVRELTANVIRARQARVGATQEEAEWLDQLAQAEAVATGMGIPLSGLIDQNPYLADYQGKPADEDKAGDAVDPNTGESYGDR